MSACSPIFRNILFKRIFNVAFIQKIFSVKSVTYETHERIFPFNAPPQFKVHLKVLICSCFITTNSTTIFSIQVDGIKIELFFIHSSLVQNEIRPFSVGWKSHSLHSLISCWFIEKSQLPCYHIQCI